MATTRTKRQTSETERPTTEVQPVQRPFSPAQRLAILAEYESYPRGDSRRGELLRPHGLYSSHMTKWRQQRDRGALTNHTQPLAGRPVAPRDPQADELARLRAENARLQAELEKAQLVIDVQKKLPRCLARAVRPRSAATAPDGSSPGTRPHAGRGGRLCRAWCAPLQLLLRPATLPSASHSITAATLASGLER